MTYSWYAVLVLMVCNTFSFIDRQILGLLVTPIKRDLGISDTRIGLLQGIAFALFYTLMGLPIGRMADNFSRRRIISTGIAVWSVMTALCSSAKSFASLFLARIGVGVGEATLAPSAFSLIADYFPPRQLGTALSVYSMGIMLGSGLALALGGVIVRARPARWSRDVVVGAGARLPAANRHLAAPPRTMAGLRMFSRTSTGTRWAPDEASWRTRRAEA